jgi:cytochrome c-type biogenesis protein CcmH/NrfG
MNDAEMDKLLERIAAGEPPQALFKEQALRASLAAFAQGRRSRVRWRAAGLAAAALLMATVSFLLGRYSQPPTGREPTPATSPAASPHFVQSPGQDRVGAQGVAVSDDLVAWLEAARLFRQLGMEDRMARAVDRAHQLLPYDTLTGAVACDRGMGFQPMNHRQDADATSPREAPASPPWSRPSSFETTNRIMALSFGE